MADAEERTAEEKAMKPETTNLEELAKHLHPVVEAQIISDVLTGGNHLASALIAAGCHPADQADYESVRAIFKPPVPDMWVAWKAIIDLSNWRAMKHAQ